MQELFSDGWSDYILLDSGDGKRLEQIGGFFVVRPEPHALWKQSNPEHQGWKSPHAHFLSESKEWEIKGLPEKWNISWEGVQIKVKTTPYRHIGMFPEQASQWKLLKEYTEKFIATHKRAPKVLNAFAYTGIASSILAKAGAEVTHLDASKGSVQWASDNAELNGVQVRWIVDDALKYCERAVRREEKYDIIMMDPPVFGRGPKGEIWRLEEGLARLLAAARQLLTPHGIFHLNIYATDLYPYAIVRLVEQELNRKVTLSVVGLSESEGKKPLQTGYLVSAE